MYSIQGTDITFIQDIENITYCASNMAFSPNGNFLAFSTEFHVRVFSVSDTLLKHNSYLCADNLYEPLIRIFGRDIETISFSPDGEMIVVGGRFKNVAKIYKKVPYIDNTHVFTYGAGTADDPYQVWNADDLNGVRDYLSAHFKQMADIDLSAYENWQPIGTKTVYFTGTYDGNNHEIKNLNIDKSNMEDVGLFGCIYEASIKNINIRDSNINVKNISNVGGLTGLDYYCSTFINCNFEGNIVAEDISNCGGLIGCGKPNIKHSYSKGNITINGHCMCCGGLIGVYNTTYDYREIKNCYSRVNILNNSNSRYIHYASGLIGTISSSEVIKCCYSSGTIIVSPDTIIRGIGYQAQKQNSNTHFCYYDSELSGCIDTDNGEPKTTLEMKQQESFIGWDFISDWGINSSINDGYPYLLPPYVFSGSGTEEDPYLVATARDLYEVRNRLTSHFKQVADIDLSIFSNWKPIIGNYEEAEDEMSPFFSGTYDGNGHIISNLKLERTYKEAPSDFDYCSGLFGYLYQATIKNLGLINCNIQNGFISGCLAGYSYFSTITGCCSTGNLSAIVAGGLIGFSVNSNISDCYSACSVVCGIIPDGIEEVDSCYASGLITGAFSSTITNCYSIGNISYVNSEIPCLCGGLIALNEDSTITSCYYDIETSNQSDENGTPKTTAEMKTQSTYTDWDFASVWGIDPAKNDGYPYLLWQQYPEEDTSPSTPSTSKYRAPGSYVSII